ncbi:MAG: hypothetical protein ACYC9L_03185 [Sulfuricaulis sp.]
MRNFGKLASIALLFFLGTVNAAEPIRIDGSSDAAAKASWDRMLAQSKSQTQQKLVGALIQINLAGVNSAFEVASNPDLQSLSVARIKDKIAGLTAEQIIDLANRISTVKVETRAQ